MERKLYKDEHHKMVGGVCAGLADYFNIDVTIIRIVFLVGLVLHGASFVPYVVLWIVLPKKNYLFNQPFVDYTVPPGEPAQSPFSAEPFVAPKAPKSHTGSIIVGTIMLLFGLVLLSHQLDIIPYYAIRHYWPLLIIAIGLVIIFTNNKKEPWEKKEWNETKPESGDDLTKDYPTKDTPSNI